MKIIGISGKKRCGKDTVANILLSLNPDSVKVSFASALKLEIARATGFSIEYIDSHKDNFRLILQGWGTDFRRKIYGTDYWIRQLDETIVSLIDPPMVIIPDVRFENEYDYIKSKGGLMLRVERAIDYSDPHISECALDNHKFDWTIYNFGTERDLYTIIEQLDINKLYDTTRTTESDIHTPELPTLI